MTWESGSEHPWPNKPFRLAEGDLLLVSRGRHVFGLLRLERNRIYPGLPEPPDGRTRLSLKAIQTSRIDLNPAGESLGGLQWLDHQVSQDLGLSASDVPSSEQLLHKLTALHSQAERRHQGLLDAHQSLNALTEQKLFLEMEQRNSNSNSNDAAQDHGVLRHCCCCCG